MSSYFKYFPMVDYKFGDETNTSKVEDISLYADIIDQIADATTAYDEYYILPGERPDQVSEKLYGNPNYHWTFYLMNESIREQRWPVSNNKVFELAESKYATRVITTRTKLTDKFKVGQTITGVTSAATATIGKRNLDLGQLFIENIDKTFVAGESINSVNANNVTETIIVNSYEFQYNAAHHYEDAAGDTVDIDPEVGPGALINEVTYLDRVNRLNESNREIRVIKAGIIRDVVKSFRESIGSN